MNLVHLVPIIFTLYMFLISGALPFYAYLKPEVNLFDALYT
jgi:hypothetical protein